MVNNPETFKELEQTPSQPDSGQQPPLPGMEM
jgi:hypothetical protein